MSAKLRNAVENVIIGFGKPFSKVGEIFLLDKKKNPTLKSEDKNYKVKKKIFGATSFWIKKIEFL